MSTHLRQQLHIVQSLRDGSFRKIPLNGAQSIPAEAGSRYAIVDAATGKTPDNLQVRRHGDSLIIESEEHALRVEIAGFYQETGTVFVPSGQLNGETLTGIELTSSSPVLSTTATGDSIVWSAGSDTSLWPAVGFAGLGAVGVVVAVGNGGSAATPDTIAPVITSGATAPTLNENSGTGQVVYTAIATDASTVTYSLKPGGDAAAFSINASTGAVTLTGNPDFATQASFSFTVVATDADGNSSEQAVTLEINDLPAGGVTITGITTEDQTLTADTTTLADGNGLGPLAYQWQRNGTDIAGATNSTYTLGDADVGAAITVTVSYTDGNGTAESATSAATATVANVNDVPTGAVTISGTVTEDQTLTASSTLADADGLGVVSYQWNRGGVPIVGATNSTYVLGDADVGATITVTASYTDGQGTAEAVTSTATAAVANVNDVPTGGVSISGTATEDQTLTASNTLADADGLGVISFQWNRNGVAIGGATNSTYVLGDADVGATITVTASYTDGQGTAEAVTSTATAAVANVNDAPTGGISITGTVAEDQTLTATSTLADADGLGTLNYQWRRDGVDVVGATAQTYLLGDADVGAVMSVVVSYTDLHGTVEGPFLGGPTAAVANVNDVPTGAVTISGTVTEDQTLTASNTLADADGLGVINYQWNRGGVPIVGATNSTYVLGDADVGATITVTASYTDGQGTAEAVTSTATAAVANVNDVPTGGVSISGTATEDQTLTASNTLADADGLGVISYQWSRNGVAIGGATNSTYVLGDADVGATITVRANYTDGHGTAESVISAATAAVANVNDAPTGAVTITGTATEGQTLTANNTLADADGLGVLSYQWNRNGVAIGGATNSTYTLGGTDVGANITVAASYTDGHGTAESVASAPVVAAASVDTSIVVFDLFGGASSNHSGRNFAAGTTYTIYIRVDSNSDVLDTTPDGGGSWGTWSGANNLGADDRIVLVGSGAPIQGSGGAVARSSQSTGTGGVQTIQWDHLGAISPAAVLRAANGSLSRLTSTVAGVNTVLWVGGPWASNPNLGENNNFANAIPGGILTSQGLT